MVEVGKKVNFYRLALRRGKMHRMMLSEDDRLTGFGGGMFCYLAPVFDSSDYEGTWHRLRLEGTFSNCKYEVVAAATDADLEAILADDTVSFSDKLELLKDQSYIRRVNTDDMLLHNLQGRYLWVLINVIGSKIESSFKIEGFSVEFPQSSFVEYLPEIYQDERNSFFERYMTVLQSLYEDLEKEVDHVPQYLDYETAPDDNLRLFAEWTGRWNKGGKWTPEQLRYLIRNLSMIQSGRGTWAVMKDMVYLMTGQQAFVIEHFNWKDWANHESQFIQEYYQKYGNDEDAFIVVLNSSEKEIGISERTLEKMLEDYTPLGMICKVLYLKKKSFADSQTYLDQNKAMSTPDHVVTEGCILGDELVLS